MSKINELCKIHINGRLKIVDGDGVVLLDKQNLILRGAKTIMANALTGSPSADRKAYMSFGTDDTAPLVTDVRLGTQVHQIGCGYEDSTPPYFVDYTETDETTTSMATVVFSGVVASSVEIDIKEAGLFSIKEYLFSRIVFDEISKSAGTAWLVTWTLEMSLT